MRDAHALLVRIERRFRPALMRAFEQELERMLGGSLSAETIGRWVAIVEGSSAGRVKKAVALRVLKRKRKQAAKGERIMLSEHERRYLYEKASKHLPPLIIRKWLVAVLTCAEKNDMTLRPSSFDDAMTPFGMPAIDLDPRMEAFGITDPAIRRSLFLARRDTACGPLPEEARQWLELCGVTFVR